MYIIAGRQPSTRSSLLWCVTFYNSHFIGLKIASFENAAQWVWMQLNILWIFDISTYISLGKIREHRMWFSMKPGSCKWGGCWKFVICFQFGFSFMDVYDLKDILFLWIDFSLWCLFYLNWFLVIFLLVNSLKDVCSSFFFLMWFWG